MMDPGCRCNGDAPFPHHKAHQLLHVVDARIAGMCGERVSFSDVPSLSDFWDR